MRVVFVGTGPLGLPTLRALAGSPEYQMLAVFTRPDRPAGRGLQLQAPPIKVLAQQLHVPVRQPEEINREVETLQQLQPDVLVVAAYGQILSGKLLRIPRLGSINLHASLLPRYRGAAPIQWALIRGETVTGVTTFLMDEGLDTGPILLQRECPIRDADTAGSLEKTLADLGAELMPDTLQGLAAGTLTPRPQDHSQASHAPKIQKELAKLDWTKSARELFHLIRALHPAPGAYTFYAGKRLKIHRSRVVGDSGTHEAVGTVIDFGPLGPMVQTGQGALELVEVQPEGKRVTTGMDFVRGQRVQIGERLS
jgi:methionyl-tRNA formyltransferase